jgi:hypothetical protein
MRGAYFIGGRRCQASRQLAQLALVIRQFQVGRARAPGATTVSGIIVGFLLEKHATMIAS